MIWNACNTNLDENPGTLENVAEVLLDTFNKVKFFIVQTKVAGGDAIATLVEYDFMGKVTPFSPAQLMLKPEGQRTWNWLMVLAYPNLQLENDSIVQYNGDKYRVMANQDWSSRGYVEYHLVEDWRISGQ